MHWIYSYANRTGFFCDAINWNKIISYACDNSLIQFQLFFYSRFFYIATAMHSLTLTSIFVCVRARKRSLVWNGQSHASKRTHADHFVFVWPNKKNFMQISVIDNFSWQRANHSILYLQIEHVNLYTISSLDLRSFHSRVKIQRNTSRILVRVTPAHDFSSYRKTVCAILCRFNFKPENEDVQIL